MDEGFEDGVCFGRHRIPRVEFFQWEDSRCHQQSDGIADDLLGGVWVVRDRLDFLALFNAVKQHFGGLA